MSEELENQNDGVQETNTEVNTQEKDWKSEYETVKALLEKEIQEKKEAKNKAKEASKEAKTKEGDIEGLRQHYESELAEKNNALTALEQRVLGRERDSLIKEALAEEKGSTRLLQPHLEARIKSEMVDGEPTLTVLDDEGKPMYVKGKPATIRDLVKSFRENDDFATAFAASGTSGSGTLNQGSPKANAKDNPFISGNWTEQEKLYHEDRARYELLKQQAAAIKQS